MQQIFENFKNWANDRFKGDVLISGSEIRVNSIFVDDNKYHLWCSPKGGKNNIKNGVYHCFKTDNKGSLIKLIRLVDRCSFGEAIEVLSGKKSIRQLEEQLIAFLEKEDSNDLIPESTKKIKNIALPDGSFLISDLPKNNFWRNLAENYLSKRKLPIKGLYVCSKKPYKARVILPYYDEKGSLIYWNARHLGNSKLKYVVPPKSCGIGKEDVLYFPYGIHHENDSNVYLCEGEFDAITLNLIGLKSVAAGGKNFNLKQANMLRNYNIIICLDNDLAGVTGACNMFKILSQTLNKKNIKFVMPHRKYKDYNDMLISEGPNILLHYIKNNENYFDFNSPIYIIEDLLKNKINQLHSY
jgi:DNA primase